jgi:hypothetical protein
MSIEAVPDRRNPLGYPLLFECRLLFRDMDGLRHINNGAIAALNVALFGTSAYNSLEEGALLLLASTTTRSSARRTDPLANRSAAFNASNSNSISKRPWLTPASRTSPCASTTGMCSGRSSCINMLCTASGLASRRRGSVEFDNRPDRLAALHHVEPFVDPLKR